MNIETDLDIKVHKVINSCKTTPQLLAANRYRILALRAEYKKDQNDQNDQNDSDVFYDAALITILSCAYVFIYLYIF